MYIVYSPRSVYNVNDAHDACSVYSVHYLYIVYFVYLVYAAFNVDSATPMQREWDTIGIESNADGM